jgi:hypothetical protein
MKFEPTLPGNPNQLVIDQHIFPRSAIQRFAAPDGLVEIDRLAGGEIFRVKPGNPLFCARRVWDQMAETTRSYRIESSYASLADRIVGGEVHSLTREMSMIVTEFYLLWNHRYRATTLSTDDLRLNFAKPERALTKEQEEILERKGAMFIRGNAIPARFINGMSIIRETDRGMLRMASARWGILRAAEGEFLAPDNAAQLSVVPLSPTIYLSDGVDDQDLPLYQVANVNRQIKNGAVAYCFAKEFARCPITRSTIPL